MADTRQAVIVIHGMGEQRPMSTLRDFADAALTPTEGTRPAYYSKRDELSGSYELRRYVVEGSGSRPVTDLYEFYWADKMTGNRFKDVLPMAKALLFRSPVKLRRSVLAFWSLGWIVIIVAASIAAMTVAREGPLALLDSPADVIGRLRGTDSADTRSLAGWLSLLGLLVVGLLQSLAVSSLADVARYLDNKPGNVGVRHTIRKAARDVLAEVHESGRYDRVVVVGHSLGSIIGLEMIKNYWAEVHDRHGNPQTPAQDSLKALGALRDTSASSDDLHKAQLAVWREQRALGVPWLVTDFVSVGSPLTHADWLLASGRDELRALLDRRELPRTPPTADKPGPYSHPRSYSTAAGMRTLRVLNEDAVFGCTRWTNIWFPTKFFVFGDPFGGPLAGLFGPGVADRPVERGPLRLRRFPVLAHTKYWSLRGAREDGDHIGHLVSALQLDSNSWLTHQTSNRLEEDDKPSKGRNGTLTRTNAFIAVSFVLLLLQRAWRRGGPFGREGEAENLLRLRPLESRENSDTL